MSVVSRACHWSIAPCVLVHCPVGIWNCHPVFTWCMAIASPSALLHVNSRHSLSLQVAQFHILKIQQDSSTPAHCALHTGRVTQSHFYATRCQTSFLPTSGPQTAQIWTPLIIRSAWAVMQHQVYEKHVNDFDELCQCLVSVWHSIGQNVIDEAVACMTQCLCTSKRQSFWAPDVK